MHAELLRLQKHFRVLLNANTPEQRLAAAQTLRHALDQLGDESLPPAPSPTHVLEQQRAMLTEVGSVLRELSDDQLDAFNNLLPWAAATADERGRLVGRPWSQAKRANVQTLLDPRLEKFNEMFPIAGRRVLELGCFEGIHTTGLLHLGARVTAADARIENVLKTLARLWIYGYRASVLLWNLEGAPPAVAPPRWDILHHIGVLYHLTDPVGHLNALLPRTKQAVLLDTHVARSPEETVDAYPTGQRYFLFKETPNDGPFAGMADHAKWLLVEDIIDLLKAAGFVRVETIRDANERNGRRVTLFAFRT